MKSLKSIKGLKDISVNNLHLV